MRAMPNFALAAKRLFLALGSGIFCNRQIRSKNSARKFFSADATNRFFDRVAASPAAVPLSLALLAASIVFSGWLAFVGGVL